MVINESLLIVAVFKVSYKSHSMPIINESDCVNSTLAHNAESLYHKAKNPDVKYFE